MRNPIIFCLLFTLSFALAADPVLQSQPYPPDEPQPTFFEIYVNGTEVPIQVVPSVDTGGLLFLSHDFKGELRWNDKLFIRACNDAGCGYPLDWEDDKKPPRMMDVFIRRDTGPIIPED